MNNPAEFFEHYRLAAQSKNAGLMIGLYHQDAELFDMWNAYHLHGIDAIRSMVSNWFGSLGDEHLEVAFSAIELKQSSDVAFAYAFIHFRAMTSSGEVLRQMKNRMTVGFVKTAESWHVLHQHTSIPISTATLQGLFE